MDVYADDSWTDPLEEPEGSESEDED